MKSTMDPEFTIDVHTHPIPDFYREALIDAGYTTAGNDLYIDGFITPPWALESYLENRERFHYEFSVMSVMAPGVSFLKGNIRATQLARKLNDQLFAWTESYPHKLGTVCVLPPPNIKASLEEIKYCLDELHFEGVGLFTNCNGVYLGDPLYDPVFEELDRRAATVFVHPIAPRPEVTIKGVSRPAVEYTFDATRAITSLLFSGTRKKFPHMKMIFSHGGGTLPFLAARLAGYSSLPFQGGRDPKEAMKELQGYFYHLAAATSEPQLAALNAFVGASHLLIGTDSPYFPDRMIPAAQASLNSYSGFTQQDVKRIRHENAMLIFPRIAEKLSRKNPTGAKQGRAYA